LIHHISTKKWSLFPPSLLASDFDNALAAFKLGEVLRETPNKSSL